MVRIQRGDDRWNGTATSGTSWSGPARSLIARILGNEISGGPGNGQSRDEYSNVHFHELSLVGLRVPRLINHDEAFCELARRFIFHGATLRKRTLRPHEAG